MECQATRKEYRIITDYHWLSPPRGHGFKICIALCTDAVCVCIFFKDMKQDGPGWH